MCYVTRESGLGGHCSQRFATEFFQPGLWEKNLVFFVACTSTSVPLHRSPSILPCSAHVCQRMHHALEIQEILSNIFFYCSPVLSPNLSPHFHKIVFPALAALARTCRAFKEPALDALWRELIDLSPLVRCLPEASNRLSGGKMVRCQWFQEFVTLCLNLSF